MRQNSIIRIRKSLMKRNWRNQIVYSLTCLYSDDQKGSIIFKTSAFSNLSRNYGFISFLWICLLCDLCLSFLDIVGTLSSSISSTCRSRRDRYANNMSFNEENVHAMLNESCRTFLYTKSNFVLIRWSRCRFQRSDELFCHQL